MHGYQAHLRRVSRCFILHDDVWPKALLVLWRYHFSKGFAQLPVQGICFRRLEEEGDASPDGPGCWPAECEGRVLLRCFLQHFCDPQLLWQGMKQREMCADLVAFRWEPLLPQRFKAGLGCGVKRQRENACHGRLYPSECMPLLSCQEALDLIRSRMPQTLLGGALETVPLDAALGRVLAASVAADRDQPPFPRSTRDGYAVRAEDTGPRKLTGSVRAGEVWSGPAVIAGETVEVMTGAPVPDGADTVVMLEHVTLADNNTLNIESGRTLKPGENVVPRGAEARAGDTLLQPGMRISEAEVALLASIGMADVPVFRQPVAAILATGDELVRVDETPLPYQIRNSNSHALAALVTANGGVPRMLPPAADTRESLRQRIASARDAHVLLLTGGVSAGKYDLVEEVLQEFGTELLFTGVRIQPGKPAVFGRIPADATQAEQWVFGLPGNPVSTQVTALLFAMPMLRALGGETAPAPVFVGATLSTEITVRPGLTRFLPARLSCSLHAVTVEPTGWQGSGDLHSNARANCYLVVPPDAETMVAGSTVTVLLR